MVDATLGNGFDSELLCQLASHVYAFDIQLDAINRSKAKLSKFDNITYLHESFTNILNHVANFKGVVFNLGYLPNGDKSITTKHKDTLDIVKKLTSIMKQNQFIILTCYPGHDEGLIEATMLNTYIQTLDSSFLAYTFKIENRHLAPYVIIIEK